MNDTKKILTNKGQEIPKNNGILLIIVKREINSTDIFSKSENEISQMVENFEESYCPKEVNYVNTTNRLVSL